MGFEYKQTKIRKPECHQASIMNVSLNITVGKRHTVMQSLEFDWV
jgi:hypothetical protein